MSLSWVTGGPPQTVTTAAGKAKIKSVGINEAALGWHSEPRSPRHTGVDGTLCAGIPSVPIREWANGLWPSRLLTSNLLPLRSAAILRLTTCYAQLGGLGFSQISLGSLPHPSSRSFSSVNSCQLLPHNSSAHSQPMPHFPLAQGQ